MMQGEFRILTGNKADVQKTLNQWRHRYWLNFHGFFVDSLEYVILVERAAPLDVPTAGSPPPTTSMKGEPKDDDIIPFFPL